MQVRAKKHLGQHFLTDQHIAQNIVDALTNHNKYDRVLEIGPGMGVLTQYLLQKEEFTTYIIELDRDSIPYLKEHFKKLGDRIIEGDVLKYDLNTLLSSPQAQLAIIGNFPYNISTEIIFKVIDNRTIVSEVVGMFQKEVAERFAAPHGNKTYGITSVITQAFFQIDYLFTVHENVFSPPPKVKSAVIRLTRREHSLLENCNEKLFIKVVKAGFNQRRKTLRNALKTFNLKPEITAHEFFNKRAEQLSVNQFVELTRLVETGLIK